MRRPHHFLFILTLVLLSSCSAPPPDQAESPGTNSGAAASMEAAEAALRARVEALMAAFNREDIATIDGFYGESVTLIPPGEDVVTDRAQVIANLASLQTGDYQLDAEIRDLQMSGDLAITLVSYTDTFTPADGSEADGTSGRWAIVWNRGTDGQWRISREIWNLAPEAPEAPATS